MKTSISHRNLVALLAAGAMAVGLAGTVSAHPSHGGTKGPKVRDHRAVPAATLVQARFGAPQAVRPTPKAVAPTKGKWNRKDEANRKGKWNRADKRSRKAKWLARYDRNHDGVLGPREKLIMKRERFATLDLNHDGQITRIELARSMKARHRGKAAKRSKRGTRRSAFGRSQRIAKKFDRLDTNNDGVITQYEFVNAPAHQRPKTRRSRGSRAR